MRGRAPAATDGIVRRRRAGPDDRVDETLLLGCLEYRKHDRAREDQDDAATFTGLA